MKVLMIAPQPFFQPRGTPISVHQRVHALSHMGHTGDLLTYHIGKDLDIPGFRIVRIPAIPFIKEIKIGPSYAKILLDIILFWHAVVLLITHRYDVIHSHEEAAFFSVVLAAIFRKPHIYDMHSSLSKQLENSRFGHIQFLVKLFEYLENWVINTCNAMITIGADLEKQARSVNPHVPLVTIENLAVNNNGTDVERPTKEELRESLGIQGRVPIVYTGTFEHYQGLDLLFDSMKIVKESCPEASLVMVGGSAIQIEYWQNEVRKSELDDCVIFIGTVSPEETLSYLELAEVLVSPRTEGLSVPLKVYTYLASGKPTVATRLLAHTQVLTDETSVLVEPEKAAFAEGICRLIRDPELRQRLGSQAQKFAQQHYSMENYLAKLSKIYESVQPLPFRAKEQLASSEGQ